MKIENIAPSRTTILQEIFDQFQIITQWVPNNPENVVRATHKAEVLIQLLEVEDCGSIGGFDPEAPVYEECAFMLYNRFLAVLRKHHDDSIIKSVCGFTVEKLKTYFNNLHNLH
jgi:hypothetical protein